MSSKMKVVIVGLVAFFAIAATASAYCGPGFSSKASAIKWYKTPQGKKYLPSLKHEFIKHGFMHQDQSVMAFLKSDQVVYTKTPKGYYLSSNTFCQGATYKPYKGKYKHSNMGVLAVRKKSTRKIGKPKVVQQSSSLGTTEVQEPQLDGSIKVYKVESTELTTTKTQRVRTCYSYKPLMKGYCRNVVAGKKWKVCKTKRVKTENRKTKQKKTLVRTIPAPTPVPEVTPEVPQPSPQPTPSGKPPVGIPPEPPSNPAPGPDPSPSPQDPAPGPHMCYKPNGDPVSPVMVNGVPTCPPGSYGA